MILLFLASTLYHAIPHQRAKMWLKKFDHCAIYLLIAGTYTPFLLVGLDSPLARGLENDVYFQVGLLTVIGLSAKNAILIVEFANEMNQKGHDLFEATLHACRQRLRPILMTSLAFIFGVLPMATSTGAGSGGQHAVGTGVMGGMISATILAIYFVPLFFVLVRRRFPLKPRPE